MQRLLPTILVLLAACCQCFAAEGMIDLSKAVVFTPDDSNMQEQKAVQMLVDEIAARTQIRLLITHTRPKDVPMISVSRGTLWREGVRVVAPEGYRIRIVAPISSVM